MSRPPDLDSQLARLEDAHLVARLRELDPAYLFRHNLIQDSTYASLLKNDRRALHRACAQALETAYADRLDEHAARLAQHYAEAGDAARTFEYALRAGKVAAAQHAHAEAAMQFDLACSVVNAETPSAALDELYTARGRSFELQGKYPLALENYQTLLAHAETRGDDASRLSALLHLATLFVTPNSLQDLERGRHYSMQTLELARQLGNRQAEARALWTLMLRGYFTGEAESSLEYGAQSIALSRQLGLKEQLAYALNDISHAYLSTGPTTRALESLAEARAIWQELGNLPMLADNLASAGEASVLAGRYDEALSWIAQEEELSERIGNSWNLAFGRMTTMQVLLERGEFERLLHVGDTTEPVSDESGFPFAKYIVQFTRAQTLEMFGQPEQALTMLRVPDVKDVPTIAFVHALFLSLGARLHAHAGELGPAQEFLDRAQEAVIPTDLSAFGPILVAVAQAEVDIARGNYADAIAGARRMQDRLRQAEYKIFLTDLVYLEGKAEHLAGNLAEAQTTLEHALALANEMDIKRLSWMIHAELAAVLAQRGDTAAAQAQLAAARAGADFIAAHGPPALRQSFYNRPDVRALFSNP